MYKLGRPIQRPGGPRRKRKLESGTIVEYEDIDKQRLSRNSIGSRNGVKIIGNNEETKSSIHKYYLPYNSRLSYNYYMPSTPNQAILIESDDDNKARIQNPRHDNTAEINCHVEKEGEDEDDDPWGEAEEEQEEREEDELKRSKAVNGTDSANALFNVSDLDDTESELPDEDDVGWGC